MKITRQYRKLKNAYLKVAVATCLFVIFIIPFVARFTQPLEVNAQTSKSTQKCYSVVLNGKKIGDVIDMEEAKAALLEVRADLNNKNGVTVYANVDLDFYINEEESVTLTSKAKLKEEMNKIVLNCAYIPDDIAYTVRIDDFMVTVGSEEEVVALLEAAKARMSGTEGYQVELIDTTVRGMAQRTVNVAAADITMKEAAKVLSSVDGTETVSVTQDTVFEDGILYVGFAENIEIIETKNRGANVLSVEDALELITKEKAEKTIYEVVAGDNLTVISRKTEVPLDELYALNDGLTATTTLYPGDLLIVTVPKPEISVVVKEETTYEESYTAPIIYVDNNSMYQGQSNVIKKGEPGYRRVIAVVSYANGREYNRDIINETILTEAVATVIERGTLVPPTFICPVTYYRINDKFGYRIHPVTGKVNDYHTGLDLYATTNTAVKAACGGTVTYAGWNGGYGKCIDIDHGNGLKTRYGHLNSIEVSVGQQVTQGQRIGLSGATGNVTGPHLHFEILLWGTPKNPVDYINK